MTFIMKIKFKITNLHIEEATREAQKLSEAQKSLTPRTNSENTNSEYRYFGHLVAILASSLSLFLAVRLHNLTLKS